MGIYYRKTTFTHPENALIEATVFPPWTRWVAQDADGAWWAYEVEPLQQTHGWYENEVGRRQRLMNGLAPQEWRDTLHAVRNGKAMSK